MSFEIKNNVPMMNTWEQEQHTQRGLQVMDAHAEAMLRWQKTASTEMIPSSFIECVQDVIKTEQALRDHIAAAPLFPEQAVCLEVCDMNIEGLYERIAIASALLRGEPGNLEKLMAINTGIGQAWENQPKENKEK